MIKIKELPILKESDLKYIFKNSPSARKRYKIVKKVAKGSSQNQAARESGCSVSTVNKWVKKFEESGDINCFKEEKRGPQSGHKVTEKVIITVIKAKKENPDLGGDSIYNLIKNKIYVSLRNVYRILKRYFAGEYDTLITENNGIQIEEIEQYTSYGGSYLLSYYYEKFELPKMLSEIGMSEKESKLLLYYMHSKLLGFENIDHMYHIDDDGLFFMNGLNKRPHSSAVHKTLEKLGKKFILFQKKQMELLQSGYLLNLERISLDPHFISYYGTKKEVTKDWDARRRYLHEGYRPLYAYDINSGACFYALWIKEHYKGYQKLDEILKKITNGLTGENKIRELYIDREFYCFRDLRMIGEKYGLDFTITAKNSKKLENWLSKIDGRKCGYYKNSRGKTVKVGLIEIPAKEYNKDYPYKLTLIGFEDKSKKKKQTYGYLSSIPIDRYGPTQLGKLAKSRWHQENYFKEVLHQQSHYILPSTEDNQIKGHLAMEMLGYNIIQLLKKDLPATSKLKRAELKTFKIKLFQRIAKITTTPNRITINFIKYFLEQRNLPFITKKYDRDLLKLFNNRRLCFKLL